MATIKSYTDISQSKTLAKILPIESADMRYAPFGDTHPWVWDEEVKLLENGAIPCWSLAALLDIIPNVSIEESITKEAKTWFCTSVPKNTECFESNDCDTSIDACYEMILKLHELKML